MRVRFSTRGNFNNTTSWLRRTKDKVPTSSLNKIANSGVRALSEATPVDTGATAAGWDSEVTTTSSGAEVTWFNNAHPQESVNVAIIIDTGHGTGTGGYVPPRPYITGAIDPILNKAGDQIAKEMFR